MSVWGYVLVAAAIVAVVVGLTSFLDAYSAWKKARREDQSGPR